jgi:hypothetical protein
MTVLLMLNPQKSAEPVPENVIWLNRATVQVMIVLLMALNQMELHVMMDCTALKQTDVRMANAQEAMSPAQIMRITVMEWNTAKKMAMTTSALQAVILALILV